MNVKLDENLPGSAKASFERLGHHVQDVHDEGLGGAVDTEVHRHAAAEDRILVTFDKGFGDVRAYPPGSHPGIVVLRLTDQSTPAVLDVLDRFARQYPLADLAGCLVIVQSTRVRIRRPASEERAE